MAKLIENNARGILNHSCFFTIQQDYFEEMQAYSFRKKYQNGDILFYEGDSATHLYMLLSGSIKIFKTKTSGINVVLHTLHAGEMVGEFANFGNFPYPGTAQFQDESDVLVIHFEHFQKHILTHPEIGYATIKCLIKKQKALMDIIHNEVALSVEQKIIKFLLENEAIFPKLKYFQIASMLNTAPETLSRILTKLKKNHLIHVDKRRTMTILERNILEEKLKLKRIKRTF